jgi:hypothetical protein
MILLLDAAGRTHLDAHDDFDRFHCEIDPAHATLEVARAAWAGTVELESRDVAWVPIAALLAMGTAAAVDSAAEWIAAAERMVAKAAPYGWYRAEPPAIKSHVVWRVESNGGRTIK